MKKYLLPFFITLTLVSFSSGSGFALQENKNNEISSSVIDSLLRDPGISPESASINILSLATGKPIYQKNINKTLAPASNMKVITSAAALTLLKPEYTFSTEIYADTPASASVISGNIYLKGKGDPDLTSERLWSMVRQLKNLGISEIKGDIVADDYFFDEQETGEGWKVQSYGASIYAARVSALSLNKNVVDVWVRPGKNGEKGIINLEPPNDFFEIFNNTVTGGSYPELYISREKGSNGKNQVIVKGQIGASFPAQMISINLDNPALYTAYVLKKLLQNEGILIQGTVRRAKTPPTAHQLIVSKSRPLSAIVYDFNKHSINVIGEMLLKYLGATFQGQPGTAKKGAEVIKKEFFGKKLKMSTDDLIMVDGSGLSPLNRISTNHFVSVLKYMYDNFGLRSDFLASLPLSGADGTLKKRYKNTAGERNIRAKTGFINGVSALTGYTVSKNGNPIAFSIILNNFRSYYSAISIQDNIGSYLAAGKLNR